MPGKITALAPKWSKEYYSWDELPLLIDTETASKLLQMSELAVRKWCRDGTLPASLFGNQWRIDKEKLRAKFGM